MNKNIGKPTIEMKRIFHENYNGNPDNISKAILALKEYGCFQIMTLKILISELHISLGEANMMLGSSKVW